MTTKRHRRPKIGPMHVTDAQTSRVTRARSQAEAGTRSVRAVLARVPYFQSLSPAEVRALGRGGATRVVARGTASSPRASPVSGSSSSSRARSTCGKRRRRAASRASTPRDRPPPWGKCRSSMGVAISPRRSRRRRRSSSCSRAPPSSRCVSGGRPWRSHSSKALARRVRRVATLAADLAFREVTERVARHLEAAAKAAGRPLATGTTFELALTQEQVATRLGTVRELVARALAQLRRSGVIAQRGRRVTILDPAQLATCARGRRDGGRQGRPPLP